MLHDEAIYLHGAQQYHVDKLDWDRRKAYVQPVEVDYYTDAQRKVELKTLTADESRPDARLGTRRGRRDRPGAQGDGLQEDQARHARERGRRQGQPARDGDAHHQLLVGAARTTLAAEMARAGLDLGDALKGLAHLLGTVAPVFVMADVKDLHAQSMVRSPFTDRPTLYLYDAVPGGVGFARRIWLQFDEIRAAALAHARRCPCQHGCPSCVGAVVESGRLRAQGRRVVAARRGDSRQLRGPARGSQGPPGAARPAHAQARGATVAPLLPCHPRRRPAHQGRSACRPWPPPPATSGPATTASPCRSAHAGPLPEVAGILPAGLPADLAPHEILFLDTETTGLAGGTGSLPFLVGLGWWEAGSFTVRQLFLAGARPRGAAARGDRRRCRPASGWW